MANDLDARPGQKLEDHISQVNNISLKKFKLIELNINSRLKDLTQYSLKIICLTHDIGKATQFFQDWIDPSKKNKRELKNLKNHSLFSSIFTIATFFVLRNFIKNSLKNKKIEDVDYEKIYNHFGYLSQLIVRSHHGNLKNLDIIYNSDLEEEIIEKHKIRLKNCDIDFIKKIYNEVILPSLFKDNNIIVINEKKEIEEEYHFIVDHILEIVNKILNDKDFLFKDLYHDLYLNQGKIIGASPFLGYQIFFLGKLMNSLLLESDKLNSIIYNELPSVNNLTTEKFNNILENYLKKKQYFIPNESFSEKFSTLNERRRYILNQVKEVINENFKEKIFISSLSVPTGFGKTFSGLYYGSMIHSPRSMNKISNFFQINPRIIYSLPFLSIIEQVEEIIREFLLEDKEDKKTIENTSFLVHHHLTEPIYNDKSNQEYDESIAELFIQSWSSQYILTTFNQLLNALFKGDKNSAIKFSKILNNIWILDEVQSIPLKYWKTLGEFLLLMSTIFSVNLLMMSATLPKIIESEEIKVNLGMHKNYTIHKIINKDKYKTLFDGINRIKLEYHGSITQSLFLEKIKKFTKEIIRSKKSLLIVLNTRRTAQNVYKNIKEYIFLRNEEKDLEESNIKFLAATQTPKLKAEVIEKVKEKINSNNIKKSDKDKGPLILVSTQCIEAGVDIDFDIVVRDFAPLDNIIQVAGRCNRNNRDEKSKGLVKIFKIIDDTNKRNEFYCNYIYDPHLIRLTSELFESSSNKIDFPYIYDEQEIYHLVKEHYQNIDDFFRDGRMEDERLRYQNYILSFKYSSLSTDFNLIMNMNPYSIFIEEDDKAQEIIQDYKSIINQLNNRTDKTSFPKDLYNKLLWLKKAMQKYIITAYLNNDEISELEKFDKYGGLYIISKENLKKFYSNEVGFFINNY